MGGSSSAPTCGFQEYPGYDDAKNSQCMVEGWIVQPPPSGDFQLSESMSQAFSKTFALAKHDPQGRTSLSAWWLMRWIYFDRDGDAQDVEARVQFLQKYLPSKHFQGFLTHEAAWELARKQRHRVVIHMDDTVPGNLNFNYMATGDQPVSSMHNIDETWLKHRPNLSHLVHSQFQKPVKLYSRNKSRAHKSRAHKSSANDGSPEAEIM